MQRKKKKEIKDNLNKILDKYGSCIYAKWHYDNSDPNFNLHFLLCYVEYIDRDMLKELLDTFNPKDYSYNLSPQFLKDDNFNYIQLELTPKFQRSFKRLCGLNESV